MRDRLAHHPHLVGFTLHPIHLEDLDETCRQVLGISHIAHRVFDVAGTAKLAVIGMKLEEVAPFGRYRAGTMTARVRRYFEDWPRLGVCPEGEKEKAEMKSDFVASLDAVAAQKKKKARMEKQRMKRREQRAKASAEKRLVVTVGGEDLILVV